MSEKIAKLSCTHKDAENIYPGFDLIFRENVGYELASKLLNVQGKIETDVFKVKTTYVKNICKNIGLQEGESYDPTDPRMIEFNKQMEQMQDEFDKTVIVFEETFSKKEKEKILEKAKKLGNMVMVRFANVLTK